MNTQVYPLSKLKAGLTIAEDIMGHTAFPVIPANTVLTEELLEVLRVFSVQQVTVHASAQPAGEEKEGEAVFLLPEGFPGKYAETVSQYKKEFLRWQAGSKVNIADVRQFILPLFQALQEESDWAARIHELSEPEDYRYHHGVAVGLLSGLLAQKLGCSHGQVHQLVIAGALIDSGMAKIDERIWRKTENLSFSEWAEVKKHPLLSFQFIKETPLLKPEMKLAIVQHHERLDGSGYPRGEKMEKISLFSQILAVADTYHALTSDRLHQPKASPFSALEIIRQDEFGKFNVLVTDALLQLTGKLSIGNQVELSDGRVGEVLFCHQHAPLRPLVRVHESGEIIDLTVLRSLSIVSCQQ